MKDALRQALQTTVNAITLALPTSWQGQQLPTKASAWGRWSLILADTIPATVGATMNRTPGLLTLQVMIAEGSPAKPAYVAADAVTTALRLKQQAFTAAGTGMINFAEVSGPTRTSGTQAADVYLITAPFYVDFYP